MRARLESLPPEALHPPRLLTGDDLIALGYRPGPEFSRVLRGVEDAQLESRIESREQALELARSLFRGVPGV